MSVILYCAMYKTRDILHSNGIISAFVFHRKILFLQKIVYYVIIHTYFNLIAVYLTFNRNLLVWAYWAFDGLLSSQCDFNDFQYWQGFIHVYFTIFFTKRWKDQSYLSAFMYGFVLVIQSCIYNNLVNWLLHIFSVSEWNIRILL